CSLTRATDGASSVQGPAGSMAREARWVGQPSVSSRSLTLSGTPSRRPSGVPACQRRSELRAAASAPSRSTRQKAFNCSFSRSIWPRADSVASTGESRLLRKASSSSPALMKATSSAMALFLPVVISFFLACSPAAVDDRPTWLPHLAAPFGWPTRLPLRQREERAGSRQGRRRHGLFHAMVYSTGGGPDGLQSTG